MMSAHFMLIPWHNSYIVPENWIIHLELWTHYVTYVHTYLCRVSNTLFDLTYGDLFHIIGMKSARTNQGNHVDKQVNSRLITSTKNSGLVLISETHKIIITAADNNNSLLHPNSSYFEHVPSICRSFAETGASRIREINEKRRVIIIVKPWDCKFVHCLKIHYVATIHKISLSITRMKWKT